MTYEKIDRLIEITREKNRLLKSMLTFTERQKEEIVKDAYDNLGISLSEKDKIIEEIDKLDRAFLKIFTDIKAKHSIENIDQLVAEQYPNLKELKQAVEEVSSTLLAISLLDKENTKAMKEKLEKAKMEISRLKSGRKAYKGYNYKYSESMLIDEKK